MSNYYKTLKINQTASHDEIKKAYKKLSKKYHPDVCKANNAEQKFIAIKEAYSILGNETTKNEYDKKLDYQNSFKNYQQKYYQHDTRYKNEVPKFYTEKEKIKQSWEFYKIFNFIFLFLTILVNLYYLHDNFVISIQLFYNCALLLFIAMSFYLIKIQLLIELPIQAITTISILLIFFIWSDPTFLMVASLFAIYKTIKLKIVIAKLFDDFVKYETYNY